MKRRAVHPKKLCFFESGGGRRFEAAFHNKSWRKSGQAHFHIMKVSDLREIEVKILEINKNELEKKLLSLGAKKVFDDIIEAHFFDFKDKSIKKARSSFRLRKYGCKAVITFKKFVPAKNVKARDEFEVEVSHFDTAKRIIDCLGLQEWGYLKKKRTSYSLPGVRFEFDKYLGRLSFVPGFIEIEAKNSKILYRYAKLLGFGKKDCKPWNTYQIMDYYKSKHRKNG